MKIVPRLALVPLAALLVAQTSSADAPRLAAASVAEPASEPPQEELFPRPPALQPAVEFWTRVYSEWSQDDVVFHDRDDLSIVYLEMRQKKSETPEEYRANEAAQRTIVDRYRRILLDLATHHPDPRTLAGEHARVHALFGENGNPDRWRQAADRIRVQRGLRERFLQGLVQSGLYRNHILQVLKEEGVPPEIAWLPMVESTFNLAARSAVGAAGAWQFMPGTGKLYMRVDGTVDERLDPILAARGAARLLKSNYRGLGNWPLALTAYNHGYYGMRRAVKELGTNDYMTIRRFYDGPAFGFASKNFYAEFLAALDVAENAEDHFGSQPRLPALTFDHVVVPVAMPLGELAAAIDVDGRHLWHLNPALTDAVRRGSRDVPAGYRLRVPSGLGEEAPMRLAAVAAGRSGLRTRSMESGEGRYHTVQRGDTLASIAARHGVTVSHLVSLNGIADRNHIRVGQRLKVR